VFYSALGLFGLLGAWTRCIFVFSFVVLHVSSHLLCFATYFICAQGVSGMGLYAMNLTGQPLTGTTLPGMLGSIAIDGSFHQCENVNIGSIVEPNVFDDLGESFTVEAWIKHPNPSDGRYKPFLARHPGGNKGNEEVSGGYAQEDQTHNKRLTKSQKNVLNANTKQNI
jgi:hypothetical protein